MLRSSCLVAVFVVAFAVVSQADYVPRWQRPALRIGLFLDVGNTDHDPQPELLYADLSGGTSNRMYLIDGATGAIEWSFFDWRTEDVGFITGFASGSLNPNGNKGPQLLDADGDGYDEILFAIDDPVNQANDRLVCLKSDEFVDVPSVDSKSTNTLLQNSPNPTNQATTIHYELATAGNVRIVVYDVQGRTTRTIESGRKSPGIHRVEWDGLDDAGRRVSAGAYFYALSQDGVVQVTKQMVIVR
jgi:hypothetical protein